MSHTHRFIGNSPKGQSAIEYLTTYGWMLLVVAIVGGAIFTTVQNSSQIQSTSGLANADVQIENFGVTDNGLSAELRAATSDQVEDVNVSLIDQDSGETVYSSDEKTIPVADTETVNFPNVSSSENTNTYEVVLTYDAGGLEGLTTEGTLTGRLELNGITDSGSEEGDGPTGAAVVSASGAPSFSTAPTGSEYESSWVPVEPDTSVQNGFSYFFDETSDEEYYNVSEGFYVMKYEAKPYNESSGSFDSSAGTIGHNTDYVPRSVAANKPWRDISFNENDPANGYGAVQACEALNEETDEFDVHLVTNREWMTVARQIEQTDSNWVSDPQQSSGQLIRGHSDGLSFGGDPYNASTDDGEGLYNLPSDGDDDLNNRTFKLANGQVVWDWAGNVRQWVYAEDSGGSSTNGVFDSTVATDGINDPAKEYEYDPAIVDRSTNGVGAEYNFTNGDAALRGGDWLTDDDAGVFRAYSILPDYSARRYGFRCSAVPVS